MKDPKEIKKGLKPEYPQNLGWECPVCGRGNSPFTTTCPCIQTVPKWPTQPMCPETPWYPTYKPYYYTPYYPQIDVFDPGPVYYKVTCEDRKFYCP